MAFIKPIIFFVLIVLFYQSCKSVKTFENKGTPPKRSLEDVMTQLRKNNLDFVWYDAKIDLDVESTEFGGSGSAFLRMKKDSAIWVVVKKLGIEGGRMLMREDSAFLMVFLLLDPITKTSSASYREDKSKVFFFSRTVISFSSPTVYL